MTLSSVLLIVLLLNCWYLNFIIMDLPSRNIKEILFSFVVGVLLIPVTPTTLIFYALKKSRSSSI